MSQTVRKIGGGYEASFQILENSLIFNITHPLKSQVFFGRVTDDHLPQHLRQIADSTSELYEFICQLPDEKMVMSAADELVVLVDVGKKVKEYKIPLEKADISSEESLKKKVEDLEKQLERKEFQARFYKEQYYFLLQHLQLRPEIGELERVYKRNISELFESEVKMGKSQSMLEKEEKPFDLTLSSISSKSMKVGSSEKIEKEPIKCLKLHPMTLSATSMVGYKCNICRTSLPRGELLYQCRPCDFDVCQNCISIPPQNRKYCPKQHGMTFGVAKNYLMRSCDACSKSLGFAKAFTCLQCEYDLCRECCK